MDRLVAENTQTATTAVNRMHDILGITRNTEHKDEDADDDDMEDLERTIAMNRRNAVRQSREKRRTSSTPICRRRGQPIRGKLDLKPAHERYRLLPRVCSGLFLQEALHVMLAPNPSYLYPCHVIWLRNAHKWHLLCLYIRREAGYPRPGKEVRFEVPLFVSFLQLPPKWSAELRTSRSARIVASRSNWERRYRNANPQTTKQLHGAQIYGHKCNAIEKRMRPNWP